MRQRTDRIEGQIAPQFEPDFGADILQHRRLESRVGETFGDARDTCADRPIQFTHREAVALDMLHDARRYQLGSRIYHATDDALRRNFVADETARIDAADATPLKRCPVLMEVPIGYAVLH